IMSTTAQQPVTTSIPVQLSEPEFTAFILPHLSRPNNWLRVFDTAERPQIDQGIGHQLHPIVSLLDAFKTKQEPLALDLPCKGAFDPHPSRMDGGIEEAFASTLGRRAVARILCDVGNQARIEHTLAIVGGIKAPIEIERGASQVQLHLFGYLLQRFQALRQ